MSTQLHELLLGARERGDRVLLTPRLAELLLGAIEQLVEAAGLFGRERARERRVLAQASSRSTARWVAS